MSAFFYRKSAASNSNSFLTFLESLKVVLINMVAILMMSAKLTTLGLLKINVF